MATIGDQARQNDAVQFLAEILSQAGSQREDAEKAASLLIQDAQKNT